MPIRKLRELLEEAGVDYEVIPHDPAFTAQEIAAAAHVPGKELAKTLVVRVDDRMVLAVLPASFRLSLDNLREAAGASSARLATEGEFEVLFPDCQTGAMPPFGNLYGLEVWVDAGLARDEEIVFNAGSHTELVRLAYADFERLVQPQVAPLAERHLHTVG
jgi:Ala-tRNA(Pro) deacylase